MVHYDNASDAPKRCGLATIFPTHPSAKIVGEFTPPKFGLEFVILWHVEESKLQTQAEIFHPSIIWLGVCI